ncbi:alpha-L-fucosidase [Ruminococcaceae bacterium OttesenSCG-928-L11]|nr:alpha-L-fucosidase [Ruminococcaceae bacterium OttesenSCG-928-L11]
MKKDCGQQWWKDARYGMFIHWGLYSHLAGSWKGREVSGIGEWIMKRLEIPVAEYESIAADFNPTAFDAEEYVGLAVDAGMKYLVITAKHHDGFAMYHSKCSPYNIVDATPFGRDPIAELAAACRKAGIKLCFYYSQAQDWHHPGGYGYGPVPDEEKDFRRYLDEKCLPQLKELLTQYGDIGLIWFDTPQIMSEAHSREVRDHVKSIQPDCIVSGRIGNQLGEYMSTGDNRIPLLPYDGDWEVPATLNDTWGFKENDHNWKSPESVLRLLLKINGRGGNYLLNVGPDPTGKIPASSADILREVGAFVKANGDAVYQTSVVWDYPYELESMFLTRRDYHLYLNFLDAPQNKLNFVLLNSTIKKATLLATGEELVFAQSYTPASRQHRVIVELPETLPFAVCNTVDLELEDRIPVFGTLDVL